MALSNSSPPERISIQFGAHRRCATLVWSGKECLQRRRGSPFPGY